MAILKNIITQNPDAPVGLDLIDPKTFAGGSGSIDISSIMISNNAAAEVTVEVFILDKVPATDAFYYLCKGLVIPANTSLVLDEGFSFHALSAMNTATPPVSETLRTLRIHTPATATPDLTVIIN
jgi:hypothetical protein